MAVQCPRCKDWLAAPHTPCRCTREDLRAENARLRAALSALYSAWHADAGRKGDPRMREALGAAARLLEGMAT